MITKMSEKDKKQLRDKVQARREAQKLKLYGLDKTREECEIFDKAELELSLHGKTNIKCPRCGSELLLTKTGSSSELKCLNSEPCIKRVIRGI